MKLLCGWEGSAAETITASLRLEDGMDTQTEGTEKTIELPRPMQATAQVTIRYGHESETVRHDKPGLHHQGAGVHRCLKNAKK